MESVKEKGSYSSSCIAMASGCNTFSLRKDRTFLDAPSVVFSD